jgi:hypothetical protein
MLTDKRRPVMTESVPTESGLEEEYESQTQKLIIRAMKDEAWRQELLTNPKTLIERELGITLPQGMTVEVHENTATAVHLVLPPRVLPPVPVSDADRDQFSPMMRCYMTCIPGVAGTGGAGFQSIGF